MLFFWLCTGFYHLGKGLIGVYGGNVICKVANSMPEISTHFFKARIFNDENLNQLCCNGVTCVSLCFAVLNTLQWFFNAVP